MIVTDLSLDSKFYAISFETNSFNDLMFYMSQMGVTLHRIDPTQFLSESEHKLGAYINLVVKESELRKTITTKIEQYKLSRFSYVHPTSSTDGAHIGDGSFIYPLVSLYRNSTIGKDNIVHSLTAVAHNSKTGIGCFLSGGTIIGGSTTVGDFCTFGIGVTVYDNISIVSNCQFGARTIVRKNILISRNYGLGSNNKLIKLL